MEKERKPASYEEAVAALLAVPLFQKQKNDLANTRRLLDLLGHPERRFRVIHVAGTNGKGSCCAFLESIFRTTGLKTGLFTSPHLIRVNERMRVQGEEIPDEEFLEAFCRVQEAVFALMAEGGLHPTFFEYCFAIGMCWFEKAGIRMLICETGMGGRLDATNAIESADAEVITSISLDHTRYLGDTVEKIAFEKAGILRRKVPVIVCGKDPASLGVILARAKEQDAEAVVLGPDRYQVTDRDERSVRVRLAADRVITFRVPFRAEYQAENACLAALCALRLGVEEGSVRSGIESARWPGRMQEIRKDVILDGAHNPDAVCSLAREIRRIARERRVWLLTAIVSDKNHADMVRELCRGVDYEGVVVTTAGGGRKLPEGLLAQEFRDAGARVVLEERDAEKAYRLALEKKGDSVLVCAGSLYLAGEILRVNQETDWEHFPDKERARC